VASLTPFQRFGYLYFDDPAGFAADCVAWGPDESLADYQSQILANVPRYRRECVRGPHGLGKTCDAALLVHWFCLTREALGRDWKAITTASVWRQLEVYLWPEIHKWADRLRWPMIGRPRYATGTELLDMAVKLSHGEANAVASDKPERIEGAHADEILYVFDEAKTIIPGTFDAAEGAFATGSCYALAISTPGEPNGRFFDIQSRKPGYEDWHVTSVAMQDAVAAGRMSAEWVGARRRQWGEGSAVYANRVLGEFASADEDSVIPLSWVEAANERWQAWRDSGSSPPPFTCVGVDVARSGADRTVLAARHGAIVAELREQPRADTMATTGTVAGVLRALGGYAIVDVIGIGAGVVDRLREQRLPVVAFNASEKTDQLDSSGELGFVNKRSAAWWSMRELLDPASGMEIALPLDDMLTGDLTAPKWRVSSGGRIQIESKDDIRKRLGRSTDRGDAVVQAFYTPPQPRRRRRIVFADDSVISPY
jgi:hypothetical protein